MNKYKYFIIFIGYIFKYVFGFFLYSVNLRLACIFIQYKKFFKINLFYQSFSFDNLCCLCFQFPFSHEKYKQDPFSFFLVTIQIFARRVYVILIVLSPSPLPFTYRSFDTIVLHGFTVPFSPSYLNIFFLSFTSTHSHFIF